MTSAASGTTTIKRLAGLADIVGALLGAIEIMEPAHPSRKHWKPAPRWPAISLTAWTN